MSGRTLDLHSKTFGELTTLEVTHVGNKRCWICLCSCGNLCTYPTFQLTAGNAKTCRNPIHRQSVKLGDLFGHLEVQSVYRDTKNQRYMTVCKCDCGQTRESVSVRNLQRGVTTHCGCLTKETRGKSSRKAFGFSLRNRVLSSYKRNAKTKNLLFELTDAQAITLFADICHYCGALPRKTIIKPNHYGEFVYNGIDRLDNSLGYTTDNCVTCCFVCNYLKGKYNDKDFLALIAQIYNHRVKGPSIR